MNKLETKSRSRLVKKRLALLNSQTGVRDIVDSHIEKLTVVPIVRQASLLGISRASVYYVPHPLDDRDERIMRVMDELYTKHSYYGSRRMAHDAADILKERLPPLPTVLAATVFGFVRASGYYHSHRDATNELLREQILSVLATNPSYGHRRIALALNIGKNVSDGSNTDRISSPNARILWKHFWIDIITTDPIWVLA